MGGPLASTHRGAELANRRWSRFKVAGFYPRSLLRMLHQDFVDMSGNMFLRTYIFIFLVSLLTAKISFQRCSVALTMKSSACQVVV